MTGSKVGLPKQGYPHSAKTYLDVVELLVNMLIGPAITLGDGGTAGKVKLTTPIADQDLVFLINGRLYTKATTGGQAYIDDLFDCSGFTDLGSAGYCKVLLELDTSGTGYATQGVTATAQALAVLPDRTHDRAVVGWLECGASTDWDDGGGMAGQSVNYRTGLCLE